MATSKKKIPQDDATDKSVPATKSAAKPKKAAEEVKPSVQKPVKAAPKAAEKPAAKAVVEKPLPAAKAPEKAPAKADKGKPGKAHESGKPAKAAEPEKVSPAASAAIEKIIKNKAEQKTAEAPQKKAARKTTVAVFTLDDVREVLKNRRDEAREEAQKREAARKVSAVIPENVPQQTRVLGAATLADILGFGPRPVAKVEEPVVAKREVPEKFRKYHDLLVAMREKIQRKINQRSRVANPSDSEAALAVPAQTDDDDTFDHEFALSLVANEQDALQEIDSALERIYDGTYGICEITGREISSERLEAVPFARFSVEGQAQFEMQNRRKAQRTTSFLDSTEDAGSFAGEEADE